MIAAYKENGQFIMILVVMYVLGVWGGPLVYPVYILFLFLYGTRGFYFEVIIIALWTLMLADYVPVEGAPYDDLKFAKTLKPLIPIALFLFFIRDRERFKPYPRLVLHFIPFFVIVSVALVYAINFQIGMQKTISFILMYLCIPLFTVFLWREMGERFWKGLITFIIGMMMIGILLGFVAPDIAMKVGRFKGVLGNPNGLGIFLNLTFMMWILVRHLKLATFTKGENRLILTVILVSLFWSGSRNGMLSMFLFFIMFKTIQINWFLAIILLAIFLGFSNQIFQVFVIVVEFFGSQEYFRIDSIEEGSGRSVAWIFVWEQVQNYLFIGGGLGQDEQIMRPNYRWLAKLGHQGGVHNSYLSMWMDSGILGLTAYFGGLFAWMTKAMKKNYIIIAVIISLVFNIYFESWLVGSLNPFTILYLMVLTIFSGTILDDVLTKTETDSELQVTV